MSIAFKIILFTFIVALGLYLFLYFPASHFVEKVVQRTAYYSDEVLSALVNEGVKAYSEAYTIGPQK